ncbi:DUF3139 domain-containing protein [Paenibacillus sp. M-152]|uniref:DUF3139 domain-containing protein n=1 Tax=Paenibacillus sp. M-152 TaxID=2487928 RepID=UPI001F0C951C|nr:DUF3139 domain-containing protein [Paenibacillus sp. M-152]
MKKYGIAIFIATLFASIWILSSYTKSYTQNEVFSYLIKDQGYKPSEIYSVETQIAKAPLISTQVIFKDEINARYFYKRSKVKLFSITKPLLKE